MSVVPRKYVLRLIVGAISQSDFLESFANTTDIYICIYILELPRRHPPSESAPEANLAERGELERMENVH